MEKDKLHSFIDRFLYHRFEMLNAFKMELSQELVDLDLTFPHVLILRILFLRFGEAVQMTSLANEMKISPAMTTHLVDRLQKLELVRRGRDQADRRVVNVSLTKKGETLVLGFHKLEKERIMTFLNGLNPQDRHQFISSIDSLVEIIKRHGGECITGRTEGNEVDH